MLKDYCLVLQKELIDIFRDKRSFITLFIPVLIFPVMYFLMGTQLSGGNITENIPCIVNCKTENDQIIFENIFGKT